MIIGVELRLDAIKHQPAIRCDHAPGDIVEAGDFLSDPVEDFSGYPVFKGQLAVCVVKVDLIPA